MQTSIAQSTIASINLMNTLRSINREKERVSQNPTAVKHLDECKVLRRKIYRYVSPDSEPPSKRLIKLLESKHHRLHYHVY